MTDYYPPLTPGQYFHIFNHATGKDNLFAREGNYYFFLEKFGAHINNYCETFSYCLLPNHFHFLIRVKEESEIQKTLTPENIASYLTKDYENLVSKKYSNLFSSYSQSFNKEQNRFGTLFIRRFKRTLITSDEHFKSVLFYIHNNPVHHGLVKSIDDWKYSSWHSLLSMKPTQLKRDYVIDKFGDVSNLRAFHNQLANEKTALEMEFP